MRIIFKTFIFILIVLGSSCSQESSSNQTPDQDTIAFDEDIMDTTGPFSEEIMDTTAMHSIQKLGDISIDWETLLLEDAEGTAAMNGNGHTYLALSGNDRYRFSILDLNEPLGEAGPEKRRIFGIGFLKKYKDNLSQMNIPYIETEFNGVKALEYTISEPQRSAKSLLFIYGNNSYTIQVSVEEDLKEKYNRFLQSVHF